MRFHFDLTNGETVLPDLVGVEAASLDDVLQQTQAVISEMMARGDLDGLCPGWRMIIRDEQGTVYEQVNVETYYH